jgi:hypothetical protein
MFTRQILTTVSEEWLKNISLFQLMRIHEMANISYTCPFSMTDVHTSDPDGSLGRMVENRPT